MAEGLVISEGRLGREDGQAVNSLILDGSLIVSGQDLSPVALADLPVMTTPMSGTELVAVEQSGVAVKATTAELGGHPIENLAGTERTRQHWFTDCEGPSLPVATNATIIPGDKLQLVSAGTGTQLSQGATLGEYGVWDMTTGTTATGRCGVNATHPALYLFDPAQRIAFGARIRLPAVSDGTETYRVVVGFGDVATLAPSDASIRFVSPAAAGNWAATIRDDGAEIFSADTGIATDNAGVNFHTFVVEFTPTFGARFWIDGTLRASEPTIRPDTTGNLGTWGVGIIKSAGTTARVLELDGVSWDVFTGSRWNNMP